MRARRNRPLFLIDISVPRNIAPEVQSVDGAYLYNIDDLETIVRENTQWREQDRALCHAIIERKTAAIVQKLGLEGQSCEAMRPVALPALALG